MSVESRLDEARDKLADARKVARKRDAHSDELAHAVKEMREVIADKRANRKELDVVTDSEQRDRIADKIEALEAELDRAVDRLDRVERRDKAAQHELDRHKHRVARLRDRRRQIKAAKGDLTDHFSMPEFNCREGGPVPEYMRPHLEELCKRVLEPMRAKFGSCHVNSGHRWHFYNVKIGGALNSYHEYEARRQDPAADCTFERGSPAEWAAYARSLGVGGVGQYSSFCHIDSGPRRDWWG